MSEALKPCPFCGSEEVELADSSVPKINGRGFKQAVYCNDCFCEWPTADHESDAMEAWNNQALTAERDRLHEEVAKLKKGEARLNDGLSKIAQAIGVLTPLELIALADSNEQDYIDLLLVWIQKHGPTAKIATLRGLLERAVATFRNIDIATTFDEHTKLASEIESALEK